jgi:hypothetical protein
MRIIAVAALAALCSGCVTGEKVSFRPTQQQEAVVRDGNPALVSKRKNSIVLIRPAGRQIASGARPVFVIGMTNISGAPLNFRVAEVEAFQVVNQQESALKVITYEDLVAEERNRQIAAAIFTGLGAAANSYSAAQAGRYSSHSTVYTPRGAYNVTTTGYSPAAAAIAQSNANAQNSAMISNVVERGQQNMAALEASVIKDNTLMPNEWYGGQLHLSPLESDGSGSAKNYKIAVRVGGDLHEIDVMQDAAR